MDLESKKEMLSQIAKQPKTGSNANYSKEFKSQIVEVYNSGSYRSIAECARSYNIPEKLMYQWISSHKKNATSTGSAELQSLRKEMARLKMENEILKKATVYFAKQMK